MVLSGLTGGMTMSGTGTASALAVFGLGLLAAGCHDRATPTAPARVAAATAIVERNDVFGAFYINDDDNKLA